MRQEPPGLSYLAPIDSLVSIHFVLIAIRIYFVLLLLIYRTSYHTSLCLGSLCKKDIMHLPTCTNSSMKTQL